LGGAVGDVGAVAAAGAEGAPLDSVTLGSPPRAVPRAIPTIATIPAKAEMSDLYDSHFGIKNDQMPLKDGCTNVFNCKA
jgi:hypothetical protein